MPLYSFLILKYCQIRPPPPSDAVLTPAISLITGRLVEGENILFLGRISSRQGPDGRKGSTTNSTATCSTWRGISSVRLYLARDSPYDENEVLPQNTTHHIQKSCYQRGSPCQDPAGNWTTRRPPDLLTTVKRRKLQWYGHVSRSSGLANTILQGTVKGGRRQGRQRKRGKDNMREWTGLEFTKTKRAMKNKEKWRKLVMKSSVVPKRPSRLRNR